MTNRELGRKREGNALGPRCWVLGFRPSAKRAFTLVEMLVVLAITAVLLGIIIIPMIQSFNLTRAAEGLADEQERGRILVEQVSRDVSNGTAVADNEGLNGETMITVPFNGASYDIPIYNSRIDIYKLARTGPPATNGYFNQHNGHYDPTLQDNNGQPYFPATPGATVVRYFVGLRHPLNNAGTAAATYNNPYDGLLMPISGGSDNLFVLYRAEFQPYLPGGAPNTTLFKLSPSNPNQPYIDDPYFFNLSANDPNLTANGGAAQQINRITAWEKISTVVTEDTRFDMIEPLYNLNSRQVYTYPAVYNGNTVQLPKIVSLIQFRPAPVAQEAATGQTALSFGNETAVGSKSFLGSDGNTYVNPSVGIASDVLRTSLGAWNSAVITGIPFPPLNQAPPYAPSIPTGSTDYLVMDLRSEALPLPTAESGTPAYPTVYPTTEQNLLMFNGVANSSVPAGEVFFDLNQYANSTAANSSNAPDYPFSEALLAAENEDPVGSDWIGLGQAIRDEFIPWDYNSHSGEIDTSFDVRELGNPAAGTKNVDNSPMPLTCGNASGLGTSQTPAQDAAAQAAGANFYNAAFASVNEKFNVVYDQFPTLRPILERFIDLRVQPEGDGWCSPMDPDPGDPSPLAYVQNYVTGSANPTLATNKTPWGTSNVSSSWRGFDTVTIVPGSEVVEGPDENPGPNYGNLIRYTRVGQNPGFNQYVINYTNLPEPEDYTQIASDLMNPPGTYDYTISSYPNSGYNAQNLSAAIIQPRFKVGYIQFDSDPNVPLPAGYFHISYRFQFNRPADTLNVNYDSRSVMNVLLTMRSYPQTTNMPNPQTITLQASAPVKNFIR